MNKNQPEHNTKLRPVLPCQFNGIVQLLIPAFSSNKKGLIISIIVFAKENDKFEVMSTGHIAKTLERIFKRNVDILSSLKHSYKILSRFQYNLVSKEQGFRVRDVRSAGLPISITLLNLLRLISGKTENHSITGTGILRVDGSFSASVHENIKEKTILLQNRCIEFTNSNHCNHVFDLEVLLNNNHSSQFKNLEPHPLNETV